jgi:HEAT repeat protein
MTAAMKRREFVSLMIGALAQLKTNEAVDALIEASKSTDPETSRTAQSALASLRPVNER